MERSDVFTVLTDADRRHILRALNENGGQTTLKALSDQIAAHRHGDATGCVNERKRVKVELVHNHLPRLEEHGVVDYDRQHGDVELADAEALDAYLTFN